MKNNTLFFLTILAVTSCGETETLKLKPSKETSLTEIRQEATASNSFSTMSAATDYFLFMRGQSSPSVRYVSSSDGVNWSSQTLLPGKSSASPAAIHWNGKFYSVYKGETTSGIFLGSSSNGINWSQIQIPGATNTGPGICVYGGEIWVFFNAVGIPGYQTIPMYTKSSDGINWTAPQALCQGNCLYNLYYITVGDVYAVSPFEIYILSKGHSSQDAVIIQTDYQMSYTNTIYRYNHSNPCVLAERSDVGVAYANGLLAIKGTDTGHIFVSQGTGACRTTIQLSAKTNKRPALLYKNGKYTLIFKGYSTDVLYSYESTDGVNWSNLRVIPALETVAGPYLMVKY